MNVDHVDTRLWICVLLSVGAHAAFAEGLQQLPALEPPHHVANVKVRITAPPPPPPPDPVVPEPPPPVPPPPTVLPPPTPHKLPPPRVRAPVQAAEPVPTPEVVHAPTTTDTTTTPVFGVSMDSVSQAGGPAIHVGNNTQPQAADRAVKPEAVKPLAAPIAAFEATKPPLPQGRCYGKYTDEARDAAIEGSVVLDLIVGADGIPHDIHVTSGLPHGLTEAALAALRACRFSPGEKEGQPVAVRIRGFKITFHLADDQP